MKGSRVNLMDNLYTTKIRLLDDNEISYDFRKDSKGAELLDFTANQLDLVEKDYFGLRYVDNNKQRHWLDLTKEISKQLKDTRHPYMFFFRVKFYPTDPTKLAEEITRYQIYLQLKRDILHGSGSLVKSAKLHLLFLELQKLYWKKLLCPFNNITDLAAHIVQAEIGDFEDQLGGNYLNGLKLLPRQNEKLENKIIEYHKTLKGYNPAEAENRFLNLARSQDLYGVDPHPCKDTEEMPLYLGLTPQGMQIIREARRVSGFVWSEVNKVSCDNKIFYIQIVREKKKVNYAFRLNDNPSCKHLWKCAVEHMSFYSEEPVKSQSSKKSALSPQNLFRRSKHKYSGKTEHQLTNERDSIRRPQRKDIARKSNLRLSMQLNLKGLSSNNLQLAQPYMPNDDPNHNKDTDSQTSQTSEQVEKDSLSEFEVREFPTRTESVRNSLEGDSNSTTSSLDVSTSVNNIALNSESDSQVSNLIDMSKIKVDKDDEKNELNDNIQNLLEDESKSIKSNQVLNGNSQNKEVFDLKEILRNPIIFLMVLALILIPVSVIVQVIIARK